jgi:tetraacyldisaccharide 4'-kinase
MSPARLRKKLKEKPAGRFLLALLAMVYRCAVGLRNLLYDFGLLPSKRLKARTICIGNLTTGGTGKTSAVLAAAHALASRQVKTAILSRGYKRLRPTREVQVLLNTQNISWQETGDEPWMMHQALKGLGIPILVSPNRRLAGETALFYYDSQVLLLDDGFQHRRLKRDLDVVLLNATDPFGGGRLLPYGDLREPLSALKRAGLILLTHSDEVTPERLDEIRKTVVSHAPDTPIAEAAHRPDYLLDLKEGRRRRLNHLKGTPAVCFSAIGAPDSFETMLREIGAHIAQRWRYPDHHPYSARELQAIENLRDGMPVITTFKDFPRLPPDWQEFLKGEVLVLGVRMDILKGKSEWENAICGTAEAVA